MKIRCATNEDIPHLSSVLASAFGSDPFIRWMKEIRPDTDTFVRHFFSVLLKQTLRNGAITTTSDLHGVALWLTPLSPFGNLSTKIFFPVKILLALGIPLTRRVYRIWNLLQEERPNIPHWYLLAIGVDPEYQSRGIGSELIASKLRVCDDSRTPTYLETAEIKNLPFYKQFGFNVRKVLPIDNNLRIWTMYRRAM